MNVCLNEHKSNFDIVLQIINYVYVLLCSVCVFFLCANAFFAFLLRLNVCLVIFFSLPLVLSLFYTLSRLPLSPLLFLSILVSLVYLFLPFYATFYESVCRQHFCFILCAGAMNAYFACVNTLGERERDGAGEHRDHVRIVLFCLSSSVFSIFFAHQC